MKLIDDVIRELNELKEEHGNLECVMPDESEPYFQYVDDDAENDPVIVIE